VSSRDLLVEVGTEELPPKALRTLSRAFLDGVVEGLDRAGLAHGPARPFATPRRLAVLVESVAERQPDRQAERRGPAVRAAFDANGQPTGAALGFARSCGVEVGALERLETDKGAWLVHRSLQVGAEAASLLAGLVEEALGRLPVPKRMRWGDRDVEFVRPVHWVVMLFGADVVPARILGIPTGRETRGHRFHHPRPIELGSPAEYAERLEFVGHVVADFEVRRERVRGQVERVAAGLGGKTVMDPALLDEVTSLVEWPVALAGSFEPRFLEVPAEALVATMKGNQRYFPVVDGAGRLLPHFVAVANVESRNPKAVREGNERVVRPRLADADFFWKKDRATPLARRVEGLAGVVYQQRLGTLLDKSRRMVTLADWVARALCLDPGPARRAAELAKCDLLTEMVGEFPELQGTMGRHYARHDGEPEAVAVALDEQYMPRFAGDAPPATETGQVLSLVDKVDTLVGIFGIGQVPSGDRDPFGLRRAALGLLRTLIERGLELDLLELLRLGARAYGQFDPEALANQVFDFAMERLRAYYLDTGVAPDTFDAVLARRPTRPVDFDRRIRGVGAFRALPEAASLAAANKRIHNILRQAAGEVRGGELDPALLGEPAERALADAVAAVSPDVGALFAAGEYARALAGLAALRDTVDRFFDEVMVMVDDPALRRNRLTLLSGVSELFLRAADLSRLQG
jgi:glycyl-tRNA synthetase beta chain